MQDQGKTEGKRGAACMCGAGRRLKDSGWWVVRVHGRRRRAVGEGARWEGVSDSTARFGVRARQWFSNPRTGRRSSSLGAGQRRRRKSRGRSMPFGPTTSGRCRREKRRDTRAQGQQQVAQDAWLGGRVRFRRWPVEQRCRASCRACFGLRDVLEADDAHADAAAAGELCPASLGE